MDEIRLLEIEDKVSVLIGTKEIDISDYTDNYLLAECDINDLNGIEIQDFPDKLKILLQNSTGFGTYLFHEMEISKEDSQMCLAFICRLPNKYWNGKWGLATFLDAIRNQVVFTDGIEIGEIELEDDWKILALNVYYNFPQEITQCIEDASIRINDLVKNAEISLGGFTWKKDYDRDEMLFCKEVLTPLLRRIKFISVKFNHGTKEYGKDYTFTELTPFGDLRHYGLQAKAGNVSGGVNSQIDEIIGQINDAFIMPYYEIGSKDERYISVFIIAISGYFTDNAKDKIVQKINKGLIGSIYFFDKDKILELIEKYWTRV